MSKTDNLKIGDKIFSLKNENIIEWEIVVINPKNTRFFIVVNSDGGITQIHWKTLEYGTDNIEFFSMSKEDLINQYKKRSSYIIDELLKLL